MNFFIHWGRSTAMTLSVTLPNAPSINQKLGNGPYLHMNASMISGPTQPKYKLQVRSEQQDVYEMPFNEKNLKELLNLRLSDSEITFAVKDEGSGKAVEVKRDVNINKTIELFLKPFDYLFKPNISVHNNALKTRQRLSMRD